jgi:RimJ/RimL family protein N-acetyltransferase
MGAPWPILEGERIRLRPFALSDARDVQRLAGDRAIADTTLTVPHPYRDGMAEAWIGTHDEQWRTGKGLTLAIVERDSGRLIGSIGLAGMVAGHQGELGWWIGSADWNRGYCTEAARLLVKHAFFTLGLARIHACHLSRNPASGRVMHKLGMHHEGTRRGHVRKWGIHEDLELWGLLRPTMP